MAGVRRLTGLSNRQLRYYDQRGLVVPLRSSGGHRLYTPKDVRRLLEVHDLIRQGMKVADVLLRLAGPTPEP
jgi:MerR family glutamine synthetase transcriptional repressor